MKFHTFNLKTLDDWKTAAKTESLSGYEFEQPKANFGLQEREKPFSVYYEDSHFQGMIERVYQGSEFEIALLVAQAVEGKIRLSPILNLDLMSNISKLRALRSLLKSLFGDSKKSEFEITAIPNLDYFSAFDAKNNVIRSSLFLYSAILGGADSSVVYPFDYYFKKKSSTGSRLQRTLYEILREESFLETVNDPFRGSYVIENLTEKLAKSSWTVLQKIFKSGSIKTFKDNCDFREQEKVCFEAYSKNYLNRTETICGVNSFVDLEEVLSESEIEARDSVCSQIESVRMKLQKIEAKALLVGEFSFQEILSYQNLLQSYGIKVQLDNDEQKYDFMTGKEPQSEGIVLNPKDFNHDEFFSELKQIEKFKGALS